LGMRVGTKDPRPYPFQSTEGLDAKGIDVVLPRAGRAQALRAEFDDRQDLGGGQAPREYEGSEQGGQRTSQAVEPGAPAAKPPGDDRGQSPDRSEHELLFR